MGLKQEELITRYFEHKMSSQEEQNFLISLAASDDLRIAFRSHLELMKAVRQDKDDLRSVAQVRSRTLAALGISAAAVTPFIEQELLRGSKTEEVAAASSPSWYSRLADLARSRKFALGTGLMLGFSTATVLMTTNSSNVSTEQPATHQAATKTASSEASPGTTGSTPKQQVSQSAAASQSVSRNETIQAGKGLHTIAQRAISGVSTNGVQAKPSNSGTSLTQDPAAVGTSTPTTLPSVTKSNPGTVHINPATIERPKDSGKAE